jgi:lipid II isoglutaminyl synthase (glutamine-hydrolysing)
MRDWDELCCGVFDTIGPNLLGTLATKRIEPEYGSRVISAVDAYDRVICRFAWGAGSLSRLTRLGAGTSLPGLVIQRLSPGFVRRRARRFGDGITVVSGTNGKTTTAAMLATILGSTGHAVLANESGSNLFRGVATTLVSGPRHARAGVFEVDEGALARLVPSLQPCVLVLTNVLRDQLDRFGEPETVARLLGEAAGALPSGSAVVANADDPLLWHAVEDAKPIGFGVRVSDTVAAAPAGARMDAEPEVCPTCGGSLVYRRRTLAHLGSVHCHRCAWANPDPPTFLAEVGKPRGLDGMSISIAGIPCALRLGGIHNAYNAAAAVAAASSLGVPATDSVAALETFLPKFGRTERLPFDGRDLWLLLMKNPAGAGALVRQVVGSPRVQTVAILVNDRAADGRDISWIWDADFESLVGGMPIVAGGIRASDVAVRIKYAGGSVIAAESDPHRLLAAMTDVTVDGDGIAVLATYTAMLDFRQAVLGSRVARVEDLVALTS